MNVQAVLIQFDHYLSQKRANFEAVVIGGAALSIMGVITRDTADVDCLDPKIPDEILRHAAEFSKRFPALRLTEQWINNGPDTLARDLPLGWRDDLVPIFSGSALRLLTLSRLNLLRTKLFALCDRDQDLQDCISLRPTAEEIDLCLGWVLDRDANSEWPENVHRHFILLKKRLGYVER
jgi:hypothetical protein